MPKNPVRDLITDQEMAFARLVLSGLNDRDAAQVAGLNPDAAEGTKSKPCVRAYMREHRAAVQQQLADHEAERPRRLNPRRELVLDRLWEIANTSLELTRGSLTAQIKALSMIVAIEGFMRDRRAVSSRTSHGSAGGATEITTPSAPYDPPLASAPDTRVPFSLKKNP